MIAGGREGTGWLKENPRVRWEREGGSEGTGLLKTNPKERCVIEGGRELIG